MHPVDFPGSSEIQKPDNMTDEECFSIWAKYGFGKLFQIIGAKATMPHVAAGIDTAQYPYFLTAWKPSYEDLHALNRGEPIFIRTLSKGLPPMAVFTIDENGNCNDAG